MTTSTSITSPVWYRVTKNNSHYAQHPYDLTYMNAERLRRYKPHGRWGGGFPTREAAIAESESKGWIKVSTWKEAKELAKPYIEAMDAERAETNRLYDLSLHTTAEEVAAAIAALEPGGEVLKVWIEEDGQLRKSTSSRH